MRSAEARTAYDSLWGDGANWALGNRDTRAADREHPDHQGVAPLKNLESIASEIRVTGRMQRLERLKRQGNPPDQFAGESRDNGNSAQHPPIMHTRETEPLQDPQTGFADHRDRGVQAKRFRFDDFGARIGMRASRRRVNLMVSC